MGSIADSKYHVRVAGGLVAITALRVQLLEDADATAGGCRLWLTDLDIFHNRIAFEYLIGLVDSIVVNLQEAAFHEVEAKQSAYAQDHDLPHASDAIAHRLQERSTQESAHVAGFFRAIGSSMDNLAGVVSAVGALPADLRMADAGKVRRQKRVPLASQALVDTFLASLDDPPGWFAWANDYRNQYVHRSRNMDYVLPAGKARRRPLALEPRLTDIELVSRTGQWASFLEEDRSVTMSGVLQSALSTVGRVSGAAVALWEDRRNGCEMSQPIVTWTEAPTVAGNPRFAGYDPSPEPVTVTSVVMHPDRVTRLQVGWVMDDHIEEWRTRPSSPTSVT
jgi:hypothetical protein